MRGNFDTCFEITVGQEGGYDRNPKDRGNWTSGVIGKGELKGTKYGIAAFVYPHLDIKGLTVDDAKAIYYRDYWPKVAGDDQPAGVDLVTWDICVNSGAGRALKIERDVLKTTVSTAPSLATMARAYPDKVDLIKRMCGARAAFYRSLSTFATFGRGWLNRNATIEAQGVRMAVAATGATAEKQKDVLQKEAGKASTSAKTNGTAAGGTAGTGGAGATTDPTPWSFDWTTAGKVAVAAVLVVLVVYFVRKYIAHRERAAAYTAAAAGIIE